MINPSNIPKTKAINTSFKVAKIWLNKLLLSIRPNIVLMISLGFEKTNVLIKFFFAIYSHKPKNPITINIWQVIAKYLRNFNFFKNFLWASDIFI